MPISKPITRALALPNASIEKIAARLWSKAKRSDTGCLIWTGALSRGGYGQFAISNRNSAYAHRVAYWLTYGSFDEALDILHRCDVPACIEPSHLWLGTHQMNMDDMHRKQRWNPKQGEAHGFAKLTDSLVLEIRRLHASGYSQRQLAKQFDVSQPNIGYIVRRDTWTHLP